MVRWCPGAAAVGLPICRSPDPLSSLTQSPINQLTINQDTNKDDPAASKKFMEITEAYEVLGDDKKRQVGCGCGCVQ